jgi:hypothetical protein
MSTVKPPTVLMELAQHFRVCWETVPELSVQEGVERRIGFVLQLRGTHEPDAEHSVTTCIHCHNLFASLHIIADWLLPREQRTLMHEAEVHSPGQIYSRAQLSHSDVIFAIHVVHRGASEQFAEECVTQWLKELEWRLKVLGASEVRTEATERFGGPGRSV